VNFCTGFASIAVILVNNLLYHTVHIYLHDTNTLTHCQRKLHEVSFDASLANFGFSLCLLYLERLM